MISVGITGGIGSGKTAICRFFEWLGIPIYYADERAKLLMIEDADLKKAIITAFGPTSYLLSGQINREYLANTVFNNEEELKKLNSLVHPKVFEDTLSWMQRNSHHSYVIYEAAILFESGNYKMLDKIITVFAPKEMRIERVIKRDHTQRTDIIKRMNSQMSDEEKIKKSDFVIHNDGSEPLISQILNIHKELKGN